MLKNFAKCPHCGKQPVRLSEKTVLLNRSDGKTFHLTMFSGPYRRQVTAGDLRIDQLFCTFSYVHDRLGPNNEYVAVTIDLAQAREKDALRQVEDVADQIAGVVSRGVKVPRLYRFHGGRLEPEMG